ncbi:hypothetical protein SISSUDRAFT_1130125 [Sistotremastrum suecicum HHB10207 ss-3]|uniref:Fungal N-terminal domain-containing protein n=1 Tax=Sistotremastrum suecicum HHB10207 ss-3 TaxID=1314776 RepID=A0A166BV77_9AGAM|nr:hypothetical protein SISSUDRAFT_1130125 [Sistotremastrum suecicum HHB10207 ss-3]
MSANVTNALDALKSISSLSPFPYPQAIASIALLVYETYQSYTGRTEELQHLVAMVVETGWMVSNTCQDAGDMMTEEMKQAVDQLHRTLEGIASHIEKRKRRPRLIAMVNSKNDRIFIKDVEEDLERCVEVFKLHTRLMNLRLATQITTVSADQHDEVSKEMERVRREQLDFIESKGKKRGKEEQGESVNQESVEKLVQSPPS